MQRFQVLAVLVGLTAISPVATVQADQPFEGRWYGTLELADGHQINTLLTAEELNGNWVLRMTQIQEGRHHQPVVSWEIDGSSVTVRPIIDQVTHSWNGRLDSDSNVFTGEVLAVGERLGRFDLARTPEAATLSSVQEWSGSFISPGRDFERMELVLGHDGERWHGDLTLPVRTISDHPVQVSEAGNGLVVTCPLSTPLGFRLISPTPLLSDELPRQLIASIEEGETRSSFILTRTLDKPAVDPFHPQTPSLPSPHEVERVVLDHPIGHQLGVTLTKPKGEGPFPAAILVSSLGKFDRDHLNHGHAFQAVWADALARRGIASLRFDDRGVGQSTVPEGFPAGQFTIGDQAMDLRFLVEYLGAQPGIDQKGIGILGWGDGSLAAMDAAPSMYREVFFLVLLSSPGVPLGDLLKWRMSQRLELLPLDMASKEKVLNSYATLLDVARDPAASDDELRELVLRHQKAIAAMSPSGKSVNDESVEAGMREFASPVFRENLRFRPAMMLPRIQCPVLAVSGSLDRQTPSAFSLPYIEAAVQRTGGEIELAEIASLNHHLQPVDSVDPKDASRIRATVDPRALRIVTDWINLIVGPVPTPASKP